MSLRSQAEVIRDETEEGANTHTRVGNLLVEMVDAIEAGGGETVSPYAYGYFHNENATVIAMQDTYVRAVFADVGAADGVGFTFGEDGELTCTHVDDGFYGLYNVQVTMSIYSYGETGETVSAALGSVSAANQALVGRNTLTAGASNPQQIVINQAIGMQEGDTLTTWLKNEDSNADLYVTNFSIIVTRMARVAIP